MSGLSNLRESDDHLIGLYQADLLTIIDEATNAGRPRSQVLAAARSVAQVLVDLAERDVLPLSHEMDLLVQEYVGTDQPIARKLALPRSKPLAAFGKEPLVVHTLFVDEAGTGSFTEDAQPVLSLIGVLVEDRRIEDFDRETMALLNRYEVPQDAEIHAQHVLAAAPPFNTLAEADRDSLLKAFLQLGLNHAVGVHYLSMLKPFVTQDFRDALLLKALDAYTVNVLYFNVSLKAAAVGRIGVAKYRYLFDRTDSYGRDIRRILRALKSDPNPGLRLDALEGEPKAVDSRDHRFIQLADVIGYYLARYRQFEVTTYTPRAALRKHEEKYRAAYQLVQPKIMSFVKDGLYKLVDWKAIQQWSPPQRVPKSRASAVLADPVSPQTPRNTACPCGSGKKFKRCHGQ